MRLGKYRHYKNKEYEVLGIAKHSETLEDLVIYKALYKGDFPEGQLWVRPKAMFLEEVEINGKKIPRFEFVEKAIKSSYWFVAFLCQNTKQAIQYTKVKKRRQRAELITRTTVLMLKEKVRTWLIFCPKAWKLVLNCSL